MLPQLQDHRKCLIIRQAHWVLKNKRYPSSLQQKLSNLYHSQQLTGPQFEQLPVHPEPRRARRLPGLSTTGRSWAVQAC